MTESIWCGDPGQNGKVAVMSMQSDYARQYRDLWHHHWWWQSRKQFVLSLIQKLAQSREFEQILDIGCGDALFFDDLRRFGEPYGIEPDSILVRDDNPDKDRIDICCFDESYPEDRCYDLITMMDVLEHIEDDSAALRKLYALLKPGGYAVITVPALMSLWSMHDDVNRHFRRYSKKQLGIKLSNAGFNIHRLGYYFGWTVGPMVMRRLLSPGGNQENEQKYVVTIPSPVINKVVYCMSRVEQLVTMTLGIPIGSSLYAVIRKDDVPASAGN